MSEEEYIDLADSMNEHDEDNRYTTAMQMIIQLSKKIKKLEKRIKALEKKS